MQLQNIFQCIRKFDLDLYYSTSSTNTGSENVNTLGSQKKSTDHHRIWPFNRIRSFITIYFRYKNSLKINPTLFWTLMDDLSSNVHLIQVVSFPLRGTYKASCFQQESSKYNNENCTCDKCHFKLCITYGHCMTSYKTEINRVGSK